MATELRQERARPAMRMLRAEDAEAVAEILRQAPQAVFWPEASVKEVLEWKGRSEEHTSELQSHSDLVCRLLLEKKKKNKKKTITKRKARKLNEKIRSQSNGTHNEHMRSRQSYHHQKLESQISSRGIQYHYSKLR